MVYEAMAARDHGPWGSLTDVLGFAHHMAPHPSSDGVNDAHPFYCLRCHLPCWKRDVEERRDSHFLLVPP